jgi:hypothetical protein
LLIDNNVRQSIHYIVLLLAISLTFSQCGDQAIKTDPDFVGKWNASDGVSNYVISIDNTSSGYWHKDNKGAFLNAQGVARIKHDKLYIGLRSFAINQYPVQDSSSWSMILSGITYVKQ